MKITERTKVRALRNIALMQERKEGEVFTVPSYEVAALVAAGLVAIVRAGRPSKEA